jgi:hypothetical protein
VVILARLMSKWSSATERGRFHMVSSIFGRFFLVESSCGKIGLV